MFPYYITGTVRIEMFRNMQNAEIIRKMTEEFDEVCYTNSALNIMKYITVFVCFKINIQWVRNQWISNVSV